MLFFAIAAAAAALFTAILFFAYRRQIQKICRQTAFYKENPTNLRLTSSLPFRELNTLIDEINGVLDLSRQIERTAQKNEMELKDAITNLSHDIRTPLTSMDGYLQLLSQSASETQRAYYCAVIQSRTASLKEMLDELFTYTKLQNEDYALDLERLDFGTCVRDTLFSFYDAFQERGIEPDCDLFEKPLPVLGNEEAFRRTIQNIVKNALEHGRGAIAMTLTAEKSEAVFSCSNEVEHPEEIDPEKLFARFYRSDSARTRSSTGLGLFIAKGLTERMNGTIAAFLREDRFVLVLRFPLSP